MLDPTAVVVVIVVTIVQLVSITRKSLRLDHCILYTFATCFILVYKLVANLEQRRQVRSGERPAFDFGGAFTETICV